MVRINKGRSARIAQGDVLRDIEYIESVCEKNGIVEVSRIVFPLVVVLTQDCDLEQDYKFRWSRQGVRSQDKWLLSVLVAPLYNVEHVYLGDHLSELGMKMQSINRTATPGKNLQNNENPRYHFLNFDQRSNVSPSVADFKHYFSVNVIELKRLKNRNFVCRLATLHREDVSQRFSAFLSRIGLP